MNTAWRWQLAVSGRPRYLPFAVIRYSMLLDCTAASRPPFATEMIVAELGHDLCSPSLVEVVAILLGPSRSLLPIATLYGGSRSGRKFLGKYRTFQSSGCSLSAVGRLLATLLST